MSVYIRRKKVYFLNFHIQKKAAPLIRSAKRVGSESQTPSSNKVALNWNLGYFILMVEGFQKHVANLSPEDAGSMLAETKKVCKQFYAVKEAAMINAANTDEELLSKLQYTIKALNRLEAQLHLAASKAIPVEKTPDYIRTGLAKLSQEAIATGLSKE